ncbi:MAG: long-chain fatty acid--CoA ligase [Rhodospirillales bacterium]|nr:long-chain fatty acid--CoA ligase [Rhodospirillales bacterium]
MTEASGGLRNAAERHPWEGSYPAGVDWAEPIPAKPLYSIFDEAAAQFAGRPCVDFLGRRYTYGEISNLVNRAAKGFQRLGVVRGTRVGLCLPNSPYYLVCYFAVLKLGGIVVNFNPLYVERELATQIIDSQTEIMVTLDLAALYDKVAKMFDQAGLGQIVVCRMADILPQPKRLLFSLLKRGELAAIPADPRNVRFADLVENDGRYQPVDVDPGEVAVLQYTGGTTGVPKGAMLTHANLLANTVQVFRWFPGLQRGEERLLGVLPFFHVFAMTVVMNLGIAAGAELILLPRFELEMLLKTIHKRRPTLFPGVPTIYTAINNAPTLKKYDLSSIKFCISGGAPLPVEVKHEFEKLTGCHLVEGYGLTEASPVTNCNPIGGVDKAGSIGIPVPGTIIEIRSPDDPGKLMPTGEKGEVCVIGPQVMAGYWKRPDDTAKTIVDGRLRTGDIGFMDGDGYVFLVDRIKDVILCGGYNVYPRNVEEAIYLHPAVVEVIVIGVADAYRGQAPKAFVRLRDDATCTEKELKDFLADKLSKIELPREIEFRAELPKTMIGKLSKKELVAEEQAKAAGAADRADG